MSVDLEDYYCDLPFDTWNNYEERITQNTKLILSLFDQYNITATFFTVGYIAERHPELIEKIVSKGHEIASHSYAHIDLRKVTLEKFEEDLLKSISILQKLSKEKILGFRAPFFSINKKNFSYFKIIKKNLQYDSSIFPVKTPLYGIPEAPRHFYKMSNHDPLVEDINETFTEIPPATFRIPLIGNIPIAGGFYLRFLPIFLLKYGIKKMNNKGFSCMCYIHPKDLDPKMPRIPEYSWHYYWGLRHSIKKLESFLKEFNFSTAREVLSI